MATYAPLLHCRLKSVLLINLAIFSANNPDKSNIIFKELSELYAPTDILHVHFSIPVKELLDACILYKSHAQQISSRIDELCPTFEITVGMP